MMNPAKSFYFLFFHRARHALIVFATHTHNMMMVFWFMDFIILSIVYNLNRMNDIIARQQFQSAVNRNLIQRFILRHNLSGGKYPLVFLKPNGDRLSCFCQPKTFFFQKLYNIICPHTCILMQLSCNYNTPVDKSIRLTKPD